MYKVEVRENNQYPNDPASHYLEVVDGKWEGMHFTLGRVEFLGEQEDGSGKIEFDYNLLAVPEPYTFEENKQEIEHIVAQVLQKILENSAEKGREDETGNSDTEQSSEG